MVGSAIQREIIASHSDLNIITKSRTELDLVDQDAVRKVMEQEQPDAVILAAAKVGGINANEVMPAEFIYENIMIQSNIIHQSHMANVQKLIFLGSSCIYPKFSKQPISECELMSGALEETNEPYAVAKIAGIKMCESYNRQYDRDYRSLMPTNLYGPRDNFDLKNSHVVPALIRKFHEAKVNNLAQVKVWGSGKPKREFLFVDDLARAVMFLFKLNKESYNENIELRMSHINIGVGNDITIKELAELVKVVVDYKGDITFDLEKADGTPRKLLNVNKLDGLGWKPLVDLPDGLKETYKWFLKNITDLRGTKSFKRGGQ